MRDLIGIGRITTAMLWQAAIAKAAAIAQRQSGL
jgi:hypothetical protein